MKKICTSCGKNKTYSKNKKKSEYYMLSGRNVPRSRCKECYYEDDFRKKRCTPERMLKLMYSSMNTRATRYYLDRCKKYYENITICSKEEFIGKFLKNRKFLRLYKAYRDSGYETDLAPSPDRKDSSIGYELDNVKMVTWRENYLSAVKKGHDAKRKRKQM